MTIVNLGSIILSNLYDNVSVECTHIIDTLNSISNISSTIIIGILQMDNAIIDSIKEWNNEKNKTILVLIKENTPDGPEFLNKLLQHATDLKNANKVDYILYLKSGEVLKNVETIPEILANIHNTSISGLKLPIYDNENEYNASFKYTLRLIKPDSKFVFNYTIEPELISSLPIGKINNDTNVLCITNSSVSLSNALIARYKEINTSFPDNSARNLYYNFKLFNDRNANVSIFSQPMKSGEEEYFYDAYLFLSRSGIQVLDNAIKAFNTRKRLEPLLDIVNYFLKRSNYEMAFIFAKKTLDIEDTNNLYNKDYVRWNLLASIGLLDPKPEHFIYGKMGAIRMVYATRNVVQDTEILQKYKEMTKTVEKDWNVVDRFELSLRENLALMQEPKSAILHAVEDIK